MPGTPKLNEALVRAFNVNQYGSRIDTNLLTEGSNIVIKFNGNEAFGKEYLKFMAEEIREGCQEYFPIGGDGSDVFDFNLFPFTLHNGKWEQSDEKGMVKFVVPASTEVISNLKGNFIISCLQLVAARMIRELVYNEYSREEAEECVKESVKIARGSSNYLFSVCFDDEGFMENFIEKYEKDFEWKDNDFSDRWKVDGLSMHAKDLKLEDINKATRRTKEVIGRFFNTPSSDNQRVKRYKDAMSDLILQLTGIPIASYSRDVYVNQDRVDNKGYFAFIPEVEENGVGKRYLNIEEVNKINYAFGYNLLNDVEGQTQGTQYNKGNGVYALSYKQIASLIPKIIESSVVTKTDNSYGLVVTPSLQRRKLKQHDTQPNTILRGSHDDFYFKKQHNAPSEVTSQEIPDNSCLEEQSEVISQKNTNLLGVSQSTGGRGSAISICTINSTGSRSVSPLSMPRNKSDNTLSSQIPHISRDRSYSLNSQDSGTCSRISSVNSVVDSNPANFVSSNLPNRKAPIIMPPLEERSGEHSPPIKELPAENKPGPSFKRGSNSRSSLDKILHSTANVVKQISGSGEYTPSSEMGSTKVEKQKKSCLLL